MILAIIGCAVHRPLFPASIPRVELAPNAKVEPAEHDLDRVVAVHAGRAIPVVVDGVSTVDAVLIPPVRAVQCADSERREQGLDAALGVCYAGRARDRAYAEDRYRDLMMRYRQERARSDWMQIGIVGALITGLAMGIVAGAYQ